MSKKSCIDLIRIHDYLQSYLPLFKSATYVIIYILIENSNI